MKRLLSLVLATALALTLSLLLVACDGGDDTSDPADSGNNSGELINGGNDTENNNNNNNNNGNDVEYVFVSGTVTVKMNEAADAVLSGLGEAKSTYESPSCAFQGNDYYYDYGSFEVSTYDEGNGQFIYSVFFKDDLVETPEGLCIGAAEADVIAAYGADGKLDSGNYSYTDGNCNLMIFIKDGVVSSIEYTAVVQ